MAEATVATESIPILHRQGQTGLEEQLIGSTFSPL